MSCSLQSVRRLRPRSGVAFTLVELLVVLGLLVFVAGVGSLALRGSGSGLARDGAVALLASLIAEARQHAVSHGTPAALFLHADPLNPARFCRCVVVCEGTAGGWRPLDAVSTLPAGVVVVPNVNPLPDAGPGVCRRPGADWSRVGGGDLRSTALRAPAAFALDGVSELWVRIEFNPHGTTMETGDLVVAAGRLTGPTAPATVILENPDDVSGLSLSQYGRVTLLRHRRDL